MVRCRNGKGKLVMQVQRTSMMSGKAHIRDIDITPEQYAQWECGAMIQNVAPHLSADDREFIISGTTPEEWAAAFGDDE